VGSIVLNVILAWYLKDIYGVAGLALAFSAAVITQLGLLWVLLRSRLGTLHELDIFHSLNRMVIAGLCMGIVMQITKTLTGDIHDTDTFFKIALQGTLAGGAGVLMYGGLCYLLKLEEMMEFIASMKKKFLKIKPAQADISIDQT